MNALMKEGKIRGWGLSNAPVDYMKRAHAVCPLAAVENQYSMMWREPEKGLFDLCSAMNIAFVAYSPLGNGFLSGRFTRDAVYGKGDFRGFMGRFRPEVMDRNQALLGLIRNMAESKQTTPARIALAWELAQRPCIVPVPDTTDPQRLKKNPAAVNAALNKIDVDATYL